MSVFKNPVVIIAILGSVFVTNYFVLAITQISNGVVSKLRYVSRPFTREPDFGATGVAYKLVDLLARAESPA